jgi:S1-C subfamily serine protease
MLDKSGFVKVLVVTVATTAWLHISVASKISARSQPQPVLLSQGAIAVPTAAKQVTVRIFASTATGSGVIVQHKGQIYTVLTCAHIVGEGKDNRYTILTADGQQYSGQRVRSPLLSHADLAMVQFTSKTAYQVVAISDSKALTVGDAIYAAGFPNWQWTSADAVEDTRSWGIKALRVTDGKVAMLPEKSLQEGYQLGYTNEVDPGMSGGPVLDDKGQLVGINGHLKYPPQGIGSFTYTDGSAPSEQVYQQMEALSWAIPTAAFRQALK